MEPTQHAVANERIAEIARHLRSRPLPKDICEEDRAPAGPEGSLAMAVTSAQRACLALQLPVLLSFSSVESTLTLFILRQPGARCLEGVLGPSRSLTSAQGRRTLLRRDSGCRSWLLRPRVDASCCRSA